MYYFVIGCLIRFKNAKMREKISWVTLMAVFEGQWLFVSHQPTNGDVVDGGSVCLRKMEKRGNGSIWQ